MTSISAPLWAVFFVLLSTISAQGLLDVQTCSADGPSACSFQYESTSFIGYTTEHYSWCDWKPTGGFSHFYLTGNDSHRFAGLKKIAFSGRLTSNRACSTKGRTKCLSFQYFLEENDSVAVSVYVVNALSNAEIQLWSTSSSNSGSLSRMNQARVPINTGADYVVVIQAKQLRRKESGKYENTAYIDNVDFTDGPCDLYPSYAVVENPALSTTAETIFVAFPPTTTKQQNSTKEGSHSTFTTESKIISPENATASKMGTDSNGISIKLDSEGKTGSPDDPKDNRYVIAGVIISCVVVLAVIGIVMGALYKRNKLIFCSPERLRKNKAKYPETLQSSNSQSVPTTSHASHPRATSKQMRGQKCADSDFPDSHTLEPNPQTASTVEDSEKYYNLFHTGSDNNCGSQEPPTQAHYAVVQKGSKDRRLTSVTDDLENVYHIPDEDDHVYQNMNETRNASVVQTTPVQHDEKSYNVLDFDTIRKGVQKHSSGSSEVTSVYNHLNAQDDAYNEIDRDRKTQTIDAEYSHIH